jgi:hypothetical protein
VPKPYETPKTAGERGTNRRQVCAARLSGQRNAAAIPVYGDRRMYPDKAPDDL